MMGAVSDQQARGGVTVSGALGVAAGMAVFAAFVWNVGPGEVWSGVRNVGWMFPIIVALGGLRFLVRAWAWTLCVDEPHELRIGQAVAAVLAGDAVGNLTPLGPLVGEPAKSALVRRHVPLQPALTALAIENIFYTLSTAAMIVAGMIALLFAFDLDPALRELSEIAAGLLALVIVVAVLVLWRQPMIISRWLARAAPGSKTHSGLGRLRMVEGDIYSFARRRRGTVLPVILLETTFHALSVLETHLTLWMILGGQPAIIQSFILETANRFIPSAFKFIPFQLGVSQVGNGLVTQVLGLGTTSGGALATVRQARMGVWALIGGTLLLKLR